MSIDLCGARRGRGFGAAPFGRIGAAVDEAVKGRPGPVPAAGRQAALHGIETDVVDVMSQVVLVADRVLKEPGLPDAAPTFLSLPRLDRPFAPARREPFAGESGSDGTPAGREVAVTPRQDPHRVQVIGQEDDGFDGERPPLPLISQAPAEQVPRGRVGEEGARPAVTSVKKKVPPGRWFRRKFGTRDASWTSGAGRVRQGESRPGAALAARCLRLVSAGQVLPYGAGCVIP